MITESHPAPVFGRDGEPCPACGAPLAGDQRYCLHCGARRPEARLEFLDVLDADVRTRSVVIPGPAATAAIAAGAPRGLNATLQANAGLLALAALLVSMLLIGLLVGHWATGTPTIGAAATPAPQIIRLEGAATGAAAGQSPAAAGGGDASGAAASPGSSSKSSSKPQGKGAQQATAPKDAVSVNKLTDKKALDNAVKKGKPISTGAGKLPPTDNKAPGGGSAFEEIK